MAWTSPVRALAPRPYSPRAFSEGTGYSPHGAESPPSWVRLRRRCVASFTSLTTDPAVWVRSSANRIFTTTAAKVAVHSSVFRPAVGMAQVAPPWASPRRDCPHCSVACPHALPARPRHLTHPAVPIVTLRPRLAVRRSVPRLTLEDSKVGAHLPAPLLSASLPLASHQQASRQVAHRGHDRRLPPMVPPMVPLMVARRSPAPFTCSHPGRPSGAARDGAAYRERGVATVRQVMAPRRAGRGGGRDVGGCCGTHHGSCGRSEVRGAQRKWLFSCLRRLGAVPRRDPEEPNSRGERR